MIYDLLKPNLVSLTIQKYREEISKYLYNFEQVNWEHLDEVNIILFA